MKRIIIICEGPTEKEFCDKLLYPFFFNKNILIQACLIKKSGGGIVSWQYLKIQIEKHLLEPNIIVTTFIDYYGIIPKHGFPKWEDSAKLLVKSDRLDFLEKAMKEEIYTSKQYRFIPYIQLHEFEGLLFNNIEVFKQNFSDKECDIDIIQSVLEEFPNSEMINDGKNTAPSKRLQNIMGLNKISWNIQRCQGSKP